MKVIIIIFTKMHEPNLRNSVKQLHVLTVRASVYFLSSSSGKVGEGICRDKDGVAACEQVAVVEETCKWDEEVVVGTCTCTASHGVGEVVDSKPEEVVGMGTCMASHGVVVVAAESRLEEVVGTGTCMASHGVGEVVETCTWEMAEEETYRPEVGVETCTCKASHGAVAEGTCIPGLVGEGTCICRASLGVAAKAEEDTSPVAEESGKGSRRWLPRAS